MQTYIEPISNGHLDTGDDDDLIHTVCCMDENKVLCGLDATDFSWRTSTNEAECCVVCLHMDDADECPYFGQCVEAFSQGSSNR